MLFLIKYSCKKSSMEYSIKKIARIGGVLYLINIVVGFFAIGYVPAVIVVSGDASATAHNILVHEQLYRLGLVAHIIILLTNIPLAIVFYQLFKVVNKKTILMVVILTLVGTCIEAVNLLNQYAPLILLKKAAYLNAFTQEQLQSWSYMLFKLQATGFNLALVFFSFYNILIGYLIFRSTFIPKIVGLIISIGGGCYLFNSFANFLAPEFASSLSPYVQIPSGLGELIFCLWLLVKGVNVGRWQAKANASQISET